MQVRALQPQAVTAWWQQGHPGWAIYPVDSEQFLATGTLDSVTLPLPGEAGYTAPPSPSAAAAMAAAAGTGPPSPHMPSAVFNPAIASAFMGAAMPNDALMRAMGSFMQQGGGWERGNCFLRPGYAACPACLPACLQTALSCTLPA